MDSIPFKNRYILTTNDQEQQKIPIIIEDNKLILKSGYIIEGAEVTRKFETNHDFYNYLLRNFSFNTCKQIIKNPQTGLTYTISSPDLEKSKLIDDYTFWLKSYDDADYVIEHNITISKIHGDDEILNYFHKKYKGLTDLDDKCFYLKNGTIGECRQFELFRAFHYQYIDEPDQFEKFELFQLMGVELPFRIDVHMSTEDLWLEKLNGIGVNIGFPTQNIRIRYPKMHHIMIDTADVLLEHIRSNEREIYAKYKFKDILKFYGYEMVSYSTYQKNLIKATYFFLKNDQS